MVRPTSFFLVLASSVAAPLLFGRPAVPPAPGAPTPNKLDPFGDPLPPGAISRLGTLRFRHSWTTAPLSEAQVTGIAFAPDGRTIYSANAADKWARAWSVPDGRELRRFGGDSAIWSIAVSPDGKLLATGEANDVVRIWETSTGRLVRRFEVAGRDVQMNGPRFIYRLRFGPDSKTIAGMSTDHGNSLFIWDAATGKVIRQLAGTEGAIVDLTRDGKHFVTLFGSEARLLETDQGGDGQTVRLANDPANGAQVYAIALSPDGKSLVTSAQVGLLRSRDMATGKELWQRNLTVDANEVAFSKDGSHLFVSCPSAGKPSVMLVDALTGKDARRLDGFDRVNFAPVFSPDGKMLAIGGVNTTRLWSVATGKEVSPTVGHSGPLTTVAAGADGKFVATCSDHDTVVRLWDTASGREVRRLEGHTAGVDEVTISPDGRLLASAAGGTQIIVWEADTGRMLHKLEDNAAVGAYLRFSDDSKMLATGNKGKVVALWDCSTGKLVRELAAPPHGLASLFTFNEGRLLALDATDPDDDNDTTIRVWDVTANRPVRRFAGHHGMVNSAILSADGRMLASRGSDKTIRVWEVASGEERCRFHEPGPIENAGRWTGTQFLAFSPDCRTLVTCASDDAFARRWDLIHLREMPPLAGHRAWVGAVEFSANGGILVTGSQDTTGLVWDMASRERLQPRRGPDGPSDFARLWEDLAEHDAGKAYQAVLTLAEAGDRAAIFIGGRLKPPAAVEPSQIAKWIDELDAPQFTVRERSTAALLQVADQAEAALRMVLEKTRSAEVRQRVRRILDAAGDINPSPDRLRETRAVEVLERVGTAAARERLTALAGGPAGVSLTRDARSTLRRLQ